MKRLFIGLSTMVVSIFLVVMLSYQQNEMLFAAYDAVDLAGQSMDGETSNRETVTQALEQVAEETNSVIARRIVEPNASGVTHFVYDVYGEGVLPDELEVASGASAQTSDLITSYLIISGSLTMEQLAEVFQHVGYNAVPFPSPSFATLLLVLVGHEMTFVGVILALLTFISITLVYRMKDLKSAGIKLIAGKRYRHIMREAIVSDIK